MEKNKSFANDFIHGMLLNGGPEGELIPYSGAKKTFIELLFFCRKSASTFLFFGRKSAIILTK